ncbi:hypothetical protein [Helcococcus bovis]|uniref:hypothetical protein n=1 Tax=Helcococcus bovis TaxID=3153252 RepID=UPI0038BAA715
MKFNKQIIAEMEKAYSVNNFIVDGKLKFIVGTEKNGPLNLFDANGKYEETIVEEYGGVMSIIPVPNQKNSFLTTYKFYSPNDGYDAKIVQVKKVDGRWKVNVIAVLPFVHRFDVLSNGEENFLIACTIKSGFDFKNDWNQPGKIYVAKLPKNLDKFNGENQLGFEVLKDNLTKNHGFYKVSSGEEYALITSENGVFKVIPPINNGKWNIEKILDQSTSDSLLYDLDGDGKNELVTFSEFHGDHLDIYKEISENNFEKIYSYKKPLRFLHALNVQVINNKPILFIGHRGGERDLFALKFNDTTNTFDRIDIDSEIGTANVTSYIYNNKLRVISANRETNTVTYYTLED